MKKQILIFLLIICPVFLFSQSNEEIDSLMQMGKADIDKAANFILAAAEIDYQNDGSSIDYINKSGWFKKELQPGEQLNAATASYLLMKAFNQSGGILYKLFPGPRYAIRELKYNKLIDERTDPYKILSGEEFMVLFSEYLNWREEN